MSKRKTEDSDAEDDCSPGTSKKRPLNREEMYKEVFRDFDQLKDIADKIHHKIEELNKEVGDNMISAARDSLIESRLFMDEALAYVQQSNRHWVSFLCIPEVPMRHILKYLSFKDKANFRLCSVTTMTMVDSWDSDFKTAKIEQQERIGVIVGYDDLVFENIDLIPKAKNIKLHCYSVTPVTGECLEEISGRLVEVRGTVKMLEFLRPPMEKLEKIRFENCSTTPIPISIQNFARSLKCLELDRVDLSLLQNQSFSLPHLEKLALCTIVKGCTLGLPSLLASCENLRELSLCPFQKTDLDMGDLFLGRSCDMTGLQDSEFFFKRLKKITIGWMTSAPGLFNLLKMASGSLQDLFLGWVEYDKVSTQEQLDFSLPRLESLKLGHCNPTYLSIFTCHAQSLKRISLELIDLRPLERLEFELSSKISSLSARNSEHHNTQKLLKMVYKSAASIEELEISFCDVDPDSSVPLFPNLRKICLIETDRADYMTDIVSKSSNLKELKIWRSSLEVCGHNESLEKLTITGVDVREMEGRHDITDLLLKFPNMKKLSFERPSTCIIDKFDVGQLNLSQLTIGSIITVGLVNLLNACSSTLEVLKITESGKSNLYLDDEIEMLREEAEEYLWMNNVELMEMKALKSISIVAHVSKEYDESDFSRLGSQSFNQLLKQSSKTLERLSITLDDGQFLDDQLLSLKLDLPSLNILQIHPKPSTHALRHIRRQLPKDVMFWFFPSKHVV